MRRFFLFLWILSIAAFLYALFFGYSMVNTELLMPDKAPWFLQGYRFSSNSFFYSFIFAFVILSLSFNALGQILAAIPKVNFLVPFRKYWAGSSKALNAFADIVKSWFFMLGFNINVFLIALILFVTQHNHNEGVVNYNYHWWFIGGFVLSALLIIVWFGRLSIRRNDLLNR